MKQHYELLIIGAGPTGMAAACEAARQGVDVAVIDDQSRPGGQIYRNVDQASSQLKDILGKDYQQGSELVEKFRNSGGHYFANTSLWHLDASRQVGLLIEGKSHFINPDRLVIANGAQERPLPIEGWQLPGVMTAGAGQILLKSSGIAPDGKLVLAGSGPLLLLLAYQYLKAGIEIEAILDTTPKGRITQNIASFFPALRGIDYLLKGIDLMWAIQRAGIPFYRHVSGLKAIGENQLESVSFKSAVKNLKKHTDVTIQVDHLLWHQGVIPNTRLALAADCDVEWSSDQQCWTVKTNQYGQSSDQIYVVGDGAKIIGAKASELQGKLCGLHVAYKIGRITEKQLIDLQQPVMRKLKRHLSVRPFLDQVYAPAHEYCIPDDSAMVCRCEEVTAKQIREAAALGCAGPNQVKSFTRCGMGPCQGGQCGHSLSLILSDALEKPVEEIGLLRVRPPLSPITLGQISEL